MLKDFLDTLGVTTGRGAEDLPATVEDAKLKGAVDMLLGSTHARSGGLSALPSTR